MKDTPLSPINNILLASTIDPQQHTVNILTDVAHAMSSITPRS